MDFPRRPAATRLRSLYYYYYISSSRARRRRREGFWRPRAYSFHRSTAGRVSARPSGSPRPELRKTRGRRGADGRADGERSLSVSVRRAVNAPAVIIPRRRRKRLYRISCDFYFTHRRVLRPFFFSICPSVFSSRPFWPSPRVFVNIKQHRPGLKVLHRKRTEAAG